MSETQLVSVAGCLGYDVLEKDGILYVAVD